MSLLKANAVQLGQSLTASQNFTLYQPAIPDGTFFIANGNSASPTNLITVGSTGNLTFANSISLSAASTKTLTLNGGAGSNGLVLSSVNFVGVGTSNPACPLDTSGMIRAISKAGAYPGSGKGLEIYYESAADTAVLLSYDRGAFAYKPLAYGGLTHTFTVSGTTAMVLDSSGALTVPNIYTNTTAAVTYVAVSSAGLLQRGGVSALKYKQDIRDLESIDINKFRAVRYKSKCENDDQTIDYFGFIADEVEEAGIKELITYNDAGEPEGFQYERMTVVLLKAIQELSAELNELKQKVNA